MKIAENEANAMLAWKLCDAVFLHEAALLMCGIVPEGKDSTIITDRHPTSWPKGVLPLVTFLKTALLQKKVEGKIVLHNDSYGEDDPGNVNVEHSVIDAASLASLLRKRGVVDAFFNDTENPKAEYLDPTHASYAPKLAAAVMAWEEVALSPDLNKTLGSPKQKIEKWLRLNAAKFGLMREDGKFNEEGIKEIAKVANWQPQGGAAQTPTQAETPVSSGQKVIHIARVEVPPPTPSKAKQINSDAPFDDEIPF